MVIEVMISRGRFEPIRWGELPYIVGGLDPEQYPLLAGVDPEGNIIFNRRQIPLLLKEVTRLLENPECTEDMRSSLAQIQALVSVERLRPHELLRFVGD